MEVQLVGRFAMTVVLRMGEKVHHAVVGMAAAVALERAGALEFDKLKGIGGRILVLAAIHDFEHRALETKALARGDNFPLARITVSRTAGRHGRPAKDKRRAMVGPTDGPITMEAASHAIGRGRRWRRRAIGASGTADQKVAGEFRIARTKGERVNASRRLDYSGIRRQSGRVNVLDISVGGASDSNDEGPVGRGCPVGVREGSARISHDDEHTGHRCVSVVELAVLVGIAKHEASRRRMKLYSCQWQQ